MTTHKNSSLFSWLLLIATIFAAGCKKEKYALPVPKDILQNDAIKRTLGPNIVGENIEFAYAMALLPSKGKLVTASVEASIAGAAGTYLENNSYYTNSGGVDIPVLVGSPSVNHGAQTTVSFTVDTSAATLRYFYKIPEEARGKKVSFTFSAESSDGEKVSYNLGPYDIAKMDMVRNLTVSDGNNAFISIADLAVYNAAGAQANPGKIDILYLYRSLTTSAFNHALVAPAADPTYLPGITIPSGLSNSTKLEKVFNLQDQNLAKLQYGIFIDDLDFEKLNFTEAPNFAINLKAEAGVWVETQDKKYRAYIFINSVNNNAKSAVVSIKRYTM